MPNVAGLERYVRIAGGVLRNVQRVRGYLDGSLFTRGTFDNASTRIQRGAYRSAVRSPVPSVGIDFVRAQTLFLTRVPTTGHNAVGNLRRH